MIAGSKIGDLDHWKRKEEKETSALNERCYLRGEELLDLGLWFVEISQPGKFSQNAIIIFREKHRVDVLE